MAVTLNGNLVFCPLCQRNVRLLAVARAAMLGSVTRRTIYNYIDNGSVYALRVAGKTLRVCVSCLLVEDSVDLDAHRSPIRSRFGR